MQHCWSCLAGHALTLNPPCLPCPAACCSAPTVAAVQVSSVAGKASVTPPTAGRPWAKYELTVCFKGVTPPKCQAPPLLVDANANQDAVTDVPIANCIASTTYTVTAVALLADGTRSLASTAAEFTTPKYP